MTHSSKAPPARFTRRPCLPIVQEGQWHRLNHSLCAINCWVTSQTITMTRPCNPQIQPDTRIAIFPANPHRARIAPCQTEYDWHFISHSYCDYCRDLKCDERRDILTEALSKKRRSAPMKMSAKRCGKCSLLTAASSPPALLHRLLVRSRRRLCGFASMRQFIAMFFVFSHQQ